MNLGEVLACLDPLQQSAVALVYFEGRTPAEAARILAVERLALGAALAVVFRRVAYWAMADDDAAVAAISD